MDRRALSPLISTLLLVAAAVIGGGVVYAIFASQTGTITAHAVVENFKVAFPAAGISLGALPSGRTTSASAVAGERLLVGRTYSVVIRAYSKGSVVAERVEKVVVSG
jgi:flagellin-like protein